MAIAAVLVTALIGGSVSPRLAWLVLPAAAWTAFPAVVVVQQWRAGPLPAEAHLHMEDVRLF